MNELFSFSADVSCYHLHAAWTGQVPKSAREAPPRSSLCSWKQRIAIWPGYAVIAIRHSLYARSIEVWHIYYKCVCASLRFCPSLFSFYEILPDIYLHVDVANFVVNTASGMVRRPCTGQKHVLHTGWLCLTSIALRCFFFFREIDRALLRFLKVNHSQYQVHPFSPPQAVSNWSICVTANRTWYQPNGLPDSSKCMQAYMLYLLPLLLQ